ncbi:MAG: hypothetical protein HY961_03760 [Ignavibacteriae bacterium]|nr:hypothetical protein [Ignavibacteriota bacterium]
MAHTRIRFVLLLLAGTGACQYWGCTTGGRVAQPDRVALVEGLQLFESLIPLPPDSVIDLYSRFDPATFHATYKRELQRVRGFVDSMNTPLSDEARIETLAIDHSIENIGNAARINQTIYVSSSYFFMFNDPAVLRSLITHEYGHIYYERLTSPQREELETVWRELKARALFYIFRDGEYSGNARFGGHPDESPEELFASAYNLFRNKEEELNVRLTYVDARHYPIIQRLKALVHASVGLIN